MPKINLALAAAALIATSTVSAKAAEPSTIIGACWEYNLYKTDTKNRVERTRLEASHKICFRPDGVADGLTYHAHDAWDWSEEYMLSGNELRLGGERFGDITAIDGQSFTIEAGSDRRVYTYLCRTKSENAACEPF
ncbi:hypothetical protein [Bradyrhizobium sp. HKCCYLR20261]|uniref:hypothetical protein n=1 Tax=Bradyrhizobium sp. HKCCYLR20261 TaxID=3420760 RepID=UPI003EBE7EFB